MWLECVLLVTKINTYCWIKNNELWANNLCRSTKNKYLKICPKRRLLIKLQTMNWWSRQLLYNYKASSSSRAGREQHKNSPPAIVVFTLRTHSPHPLPEGLKMESNFFQPAIAALVSSAISVRSYRRKSLNLSGAFLGFIVMTIHIAVNYRSVVNISTCTYIYLWVWYVCIVVSLMCVWIQIWSDDASFLLYVIDADEGRAGEETERRCRVQRRRSTQLVFLPPVYLSLFTFSHYEFDGLGDDTWS